MESCEVVPLPGKASIVGGGLDIFAIAAAVVQGRAHGVHPEQLLDRRPCGLPLALVSVHY